MCATRFGEGLSSVSGGMGNCFFQFSNMLDRIMDHGVKVRRNLFDVLFVISSLVFL